MFHVYMKVETALSKAITIIIANKRYTNINEFTQIFNSLSKLSYLKGWFENRTAQSPKTIQLKLWSGK